MDSFVPMQIDFSLIDFSLKRFSRVESLHKNLSLKSFRFVNFSLFGGSVDASEGEEEKPLSELVA